MADDRIISLGDGWQRAPRRFWGSRDRAVAGALEAQSRAMTDWRLETPLPDRTVPGGFGGLYGSEQSRRRQQERELRRLLDKHGLR